MNTKFPIDADAAKRQIETTLMLREVPKHRKVTDHSRKNQESDAWSFEEDPRWLFLKSPQNRDKQYFVLVRGGPGKDPRFDNTLEYCGNFDKIVERNLYGSNLRDAYRHYTIWFNRPVTSTINENDELYYVIEEENEEADRARRQAEMERARRQAEIERARRQAEMERARRQAEMEEDRDIVKKFEFEGKKYLKSIKTNIIYDYNEFVKNGEQIIIGRWNEATQKIDFTKDYINKTPFFHPDKNIGSQAGGAKKMERLNVLSNNVKGGRKQHNKKTRKYFKKYTKTKNTKTKNTNLHLKYKKV